MIYDRRKKKLCYMRMALVGFIVAWAALGIAVAQGSLSEHAQEISMAQWYLIVGLVGLVQALIGYIYISGQRSLKESHRALVDTIKELKDHGERRDDLLLDTRKIVLELHGEHVAMMDRCSKIQAKKNDKLS